MLSLRRKLNYTYACAEKLYVLKVKNALVVCDYVTAYAADRKAVGEVNAILANSPKG